jgi:hypothetical protein
MPSDVDWIKARIAEAQKRHESVTEAVTVQMEKLLSGDLSERPLSSAKLVIIAKALIEAMVPVPSEAEAKQ